MNVARYHNVKKLNMQVMATNNNHVKSITKFMLTAKSYPATLTSDKQFSIAYGRDSRSSFGIISIKGGEHADSKTRG